MAADLGELLVPYMPTIRVPKSGNRVYKTECAFSYESPLSDGGLYVCMSTFLGFGREHVERHYRKTGQCVYMHLKRHLRPKATGASGGAHPRFINGKVFLDLETTDLNDEDYEYEDDAKLVIFPDHFEIPLPNIEELPALVTIACDAVLNAKSPYRQLDQDSWEEELQVSKFANNLVQIDNGVKIPPSGWKCSKCELRENLWLNLTDGSIMCGKWFCSGSGGNGHALEHHKQMGYPLAVKLGTITPDGADVYSFDEEEAVLDPHLAKHLSHFGIDMLQMQGNENGVLDNDVKPRINEWEVIQETGLKLKPVFGSGFTGIKNQGNSSYLSTVMQVIFSIPEFQRAYVGNLTRIFDFAPLDPTQDFNTQMAKLGHALLSGQFSKPPVKCELIEQVMKEEYKQQAKGITTRMFKALVSKSHPEFSSNRQQDAQEFYLHLINLVERNSIGLENPSDVFRYLVEDRTQCCQSRKVRYTQRVSYLMQLPVAMEAATNKDELISYELKRREAETAKRPAPELVRAKIPFRACLQAFTEPDNVDDFWSSALQAKSAAIKTSRFASFPEYLVVQIKKFTFGLDWVPKKLDVSVDMPDILDINHLRASGLQPGEEELPDIAPPIVIPDDPKDRFRNHYMEPPDIDESSVMQLAEMGFPLEACRKAVYYTGNLGAEVAFNWIIAHMEEPDFAEPLSIPGCAAASSISSYGQNVQLNQPPEEIVALISSMGFQRNQAIQALRATNNNLERALDWIFSHPESEEDCANPSESVDADNNQNSIITQNEEEGPRIKDGSGTYELFGFISHAGTSTMSGHYVCHIKKEGRWVIYNDHKVTSSERPPKELGYIYFYHRI
ncbi:ubiquitin carboxyl-terminal hydrolase 13 [Pelobates cultripes]|uniref:Ubiquitin carboxyl-terminal hydrolase n=2 Tax=Pelobates cultripes TaxID=61616 RepID=A0AAD1VU11_PELCU|nr:ubiquitin carboxyl-terminal hydrolase 13 [Pelobates cultripes]CAH2247761.1 ubiquitin carboxyl-terminal hydrolase 13 [Pelobates cultripes]CAH2247762.1 ubiquitin carboxyl-terminal hydrolase 13 [Pelobates cultripes]CAH2247763.1 ubiquitin carboxyl-terminal hydrolase 13 [Pelobates cultripes]CAH2247764.1 ubiquitin carboxyl-terminal hydrolase 13 [Pelobates cultripes]